MAVILWLNLITFQSSAVTTAAENINSKDLTGCLPTDVRRLMIQLLHTAVAFLGTLALFGAYAISREPLDALWNAHMYAGTSGAYYDGKEFVQSRPLREASFESADGRPGTVWPSNKGIRVDDLRETRFWGILRSGGWRMEGGLLARASEGAAFVELYGKSVWKVPAVLLSFGKSPPWFAEHSYEFFLLYRPGEDEKATLLKKWVIPPEQIPYDYYLRGVLRYDSTQKVATVNITDVERKRTFLEESIDLSRANIKNSGKRK